MSPQSHTFQFPTININNVVDTLTSKEGASTYSVMKSFVVIEFRKMQTHTFLEY
jgi:hypothetical protein